MNLIRCLLPLALTVTTLLSAGCQPGTSDAPQSAKEADAAPPDDGVSAQQILSALQTVYANARTYRDNGVLRLSYRKDGLRTDEPQRWSTAFSQDGRLALELFGGQVHADGRRLACYVYDIDTGNLDNQLRLQSVTGGSLPIKPLFADPIAQNFLCGYSELPLNEQDAAFQGLLVPAPLSLLTGQTKCPWLQQPDRVERLADEQLGTQSCYVIRTMALGVTCDSWIDQTSGLLAQMSLPLKLLDPQVMAAPNIEEVKLLARFEDATLGGLVDPDTFHVPPRKNVSPVTNFVPLPQSLPAESVGQTISDLRLIQPDGSAINELHFDGKTTALLWLGAENSYSAIDRLSQLADRSPTGDFAFGIIYSDAELTDSPAQPHLIRPALAAATATCNIPLFYDPNFAASSNLAIQNVPAVVVLDGNSKVQFATSVGKANWLGDLEAALQRVASGDDVGQEMLTQYQSFLTRYHTALSTANARQLLPTDSSEANRVAKGNDVNPTSTDLPPRSSGPAFEPKLLWTNRDFQQPGNISCYQSEPSRTVAAVFDGWRTIVEVDSFGKTVARHELELPDGTAVSKIRSLPDGSAHALFEPAGDRLYLFDKQWQPLGDWPPVGQQAPTKVSDAQFEGQQDGEASLLIATKPSGIVRVARTNERLVGESLMTNVVDKLAIGQQRFAAIENNRLWQGALSTERVANTSDQDVRFQDIQAIPTAAQANYLVATLLDDQTWSATFLDDSLRPMASVPIGSQLFNSSIDPLLVDRLARTSSGSATSKTQLVTLAVATSQNRVHLLNYAGTWLADVILNAPPSGIGFVRPSGRAIVVSVENRVECWSLE